VEDFFCAEFTTPYFLFLGYVMDIQRTRRSGVAAASQRTAEHATAAKLTSEQ
jgi:hypothetical protein